MWIESDNKLIKTFKFKDFSEALSFIVRVGLLSEQHAHHPTITNTFTTVVISLTTHDQNHQITDKDRILSQAIDKL